MYIFIYTYTHTVTKKFDDFGVKNPLSFNLPVLFPFFQTRFRSWRFFSHQANRYLRLQLQPADKNRLLSTPGSCVGGQSFDLVCLKKGAWKGTTKWQDMTGCKCSCWMASGSFSQVDWERLGSFSLDGPFQPVWLGDVSQKSSTGRGWRYMKILQQP